MAVTKEDQNTFVVVGGILIVCVIALVAIFAAFWTLAKEPLGIFISQVSEFLESQRVYDYNFQIPQQAFVSPTDEAPAEPEVNSEGETDYKSYPDAVLSQEELEQLENGEITMPDITITIAKVGIDSPVLQGNDSDALLKQGFWLAPISYTLGEGEVLLFCHRTYFEETDPRSCWNVDQLSQGDLIVVNVEGENLNYRVVGSSVREINDELIYDLDPNKDLIKIVTFTPRETGAQRLEIVAARVG